MEFLLYLALGACAGVLAGLFGVGGGIIIVPVLVFSFTLQGFDPPGVDAPGRGHLPGDDHLYLGECGA